jgi:hypothetical protein
MDEIGLNLIIRTLQEKIRVDLSVTPENVGEKIVFLILVGIFLLKQCLQRVTYNTYLIPRTKEQQRPLSLHPRQNMGVRELMMCYSDQYYLDEESITALR